MSNKKRVVHSQGRQIIYSVYQFMKKEKEKGGPTLPFARLQERVAEATGVGLSTVKRIVREANSKRPDNVMEIRNCLQIETGDAKEDISTSIHPSFSKSPLAKVKKNCIKTENTDNDEIIDTEIVKMELSDVYKDNQHETSYLDEEVEVKSEYLDEEVEVKSEYSDEEVEVKSESLEGSHNYYEPVS